jgi:hypothetical protein
MFNGYVILTIYKTRPQEYSRKISVQSNDGIKKYAF